ncbi:MAG: SIS domain-containing protein [Candidatus Jordarchaeales archaeon]|nr:SIS domain-containing protein [Candidatus Jordarchaeia archaeon]
MPGRQAYLILKEILEEEEAVKLTLEVASRCLEEVAPCLHSANFTYFTGSGTSYHASIVGQYALSRLASSFSSSVPASEFSQWASVKGPETLVVAISRSGETSDTLEAAEYARSHGAKVLALTNTPGSSLASVSHFILLTGAGEERSGVATKTYVSQLVALCLFSAFIGEIKGRGEAVRLKSILNELPGKVGETVRLSGEQARRLAEEHSEAEFFFVLGSGPNYATALEAALKLKEVAGVFAEGFSTREFLHGPMHLVDEKTTVIILLPPQEQADTCVDLASRLEKLGSRVITVADREVGSENQLLAPINNPILSPIFFIIPLQLLSCYLSLAREGKGELQSEVETSGY